MIAVGDENYRTDVGYRGQYLVSIIIDFLMNGVICISKDTSNFVKTIDLSGFSVCKKDLRKLLDAKFTKKEMTTIRLDLTANSCEDAEDAEYWIDRLKNSHLEFKITNFSYSIQSNEPGWWNMELIKNLNGVSGVEFSIKKKMLNYKDMVSILSFHENVENMTKLSLKGACIGDDEKHWFNRFLKTFKSLSRLNLSSSKLSNRVPDILEGLDLKYLNLSSCELTTADMKYLLTSSKIKHLNVGGKQMNLDFQELRTLNDSIEVLEINYFDRGRNFWLFLSFLKNLKSLNALIIDDKYLRKRDVLQLIDLKLRMLHIVNARFISSLRSKILFKEKLQESNYDFILTIRELSAILN